MVKRSYQCGYPIWVGARWMGEEMLLVLYDGQRRPDHRAPAIFTCPQCHRARPSRCVIFRRANAHAQRKAHRCTTPVPSVEAPRPVLSISAGATRADTGQSLLLAVSQWSCWYLAWYVWPLAELTLRKARSAFNVPSPLSRVGWLPICDKVELLFVYLLQCRGMLGEDGSHCSGCGPNWTASLLKELVAPVWDGSHCSLPLHLFSVVTEHPSGGRLCSLSTKTR